MQDTRLVHKKVYGARSRWQIVLRQNVNGYCRAARVVRRRKGRLANTGCIFNTVGKYIFTIKVRHRHIPHRKHINSNLADNRITAGRTSRGRTRHLTIDGNNQVPGIKRIVRQATGCTPAVAHIKRVYDGLTGINHPCRHVALIVITNHIDINGAAVLQHHQQRVVAVVVINGDGLVIYHAINDHLKASLSRQRHSSARQCRRSTLVGCAHGHVEGTKSVGIEHQPQTRIIGLHDYLSSPCHRRIFKITDNTQAAHIQQVRHDKISRYVVDRHHVGQTIVDAVTVGHISINKGACQINQQQACIFIPGDVR